MDSVLTLLGAGLLEALQPLNLLMIGYWLYGGAAGWCDAWSGLC